jgi:hypothetical protein
LKSSNFISNATEQIVGRERRERVSQLDSSGDACFDSRRRVNSTVMRRFLPEIREQRWSGSVPDKSRYEL